MDNPPAPMTPDPYGDAPLGEDASPAADAVQQLRRAEAHLYRKRHASQQRSATDRSAIRYVIERSREGHQVSPTDLARYLEVTSATVSAVLDRLTKAEQVVVRQHPDDKRRKIVEPHRSDDEASTSDPLTTRIRSIAAELSDEESAIVARYLARVTEAIQEAGEV